MTTDSGTILLTVVKVLKWFNSEVELLKQEDGIVRQNLKDTLVGIEEGCVGDVGLALTDLT